MKDDLYLLDIIAFLRNKEYDLTGRHTISIVKESTLNKIRVNPLIINYTEEPGWLTDYIMITVNQSLDGAFYTISKTKNIIKCVRVINNQFQYNKEIIESGFPPFQWTNFIKGIEQEQDDDEFITEIIDSIDSINIEIDNDNER